MKVSRFIVAAAAALWTLAACNQVEEPKQEEPEAPQIQVARSEVLLLSDGASVEVAYMIENPVDGQKISVSNDAEWLTVGTNKARVLTFSAGVNETGQVRQTQVLLSYEGAEDVTIDVSQEFFVSPLKVSVSGVTATSVTFSIVTSDPELTWIPMVTYKESFEYFESDDELFRNDLEYFDYLADIQDMTRAEFLDMMTAAGSMENVTFDGLQPSVDYVLYAYGVTNEGRRTTEIVSAPFTTEPPYEGDITFSFTAEEVDYVLNYTITPSHTGVPYYYGIETWDTIEQWKVKHGGSLIEAIQAEEIDSSVNELLDLGMISGPEDYYLIYNESDVMDWGYFELKADTKYVIYAVKWDEQCRLTGPVSTYEHTSQPVSASDNQITLSVENITQSSADAVTTVTTDDPYVVMPVRKSEIEGMTDEEIFVYVTTKYDYLLGEYTLTGNNTKTFSRMRPDTEYTLMAFGYKAGVMTTSELDKVDFVTLPAGNPADCTFEFKCDPDVDFAFIEVIPSDKGQFYHWLVYPSSYTTQDVKDFISLTIQHAYEGDVATFASWELSLGDDSANAWDLYPATEYKVGAVVMDYDTGEFLSEVSFSQPFTTLEKVYADITFNFEYGAYYDLGELVKAGQEQYSPLLSDGNALMPIKLTVDGKCSAFYFDIYQNDLMDEETYPDEIFYAGLEYGCTYNSSIFVVNYDVPMTLVAMAYDYDGNVTKLYRDLLFFTKDGASPVKEFIDSQKKPGKSVEVKSSPASAKMNVASKRLPEDRLTQSQIQLKHDQAMEKVETLRREKLQKDLAEAAARKSKFIAR
ncbi:MAG: hypothetical protein J6S01_07330 [Bacteroidales bacterium]|nr:hypothetical protein [Bacteroidales bacterium]